MILLFPIHFLFPGSNFLDDFIDLIIVQEGQKDFHFIKQKLSNQISSITLSL